MLVNTNQIKTGRNYRTNFIEIQQLADDIEDHGLLQPLTINTNFELLAGERRLRAVQYLGWEQVECTIVNADEQIQDEITLVENLQRSNTNAIEEAHAFRAYLDKYHCTMTELAKKLHLSADLVGSRIKLLQLHNIIQQGVIAGTIPMYIALPMANLHEAQQLAIYLWLDSDNLPNEKQFKALCSILNDGNNSLDIAKAWGSIKANAQKGRIRELHETMTDDELEAVLKARNDKRKVYAVQCVYKPYLSPELESEIAELLDDAMVECEAVFSNLQIVELNEKEIAQLKKRSNPCIFTYEVALEVQDRVNPHDVEYPYYKSGKNPDGSNRVFMAAPGGYTGGPIFPEMY